MQESSSSARYSSSHGSFRVSNFNFNLNIFNQLNIFNLFSHSYMDQGRNPQLYTKDCMEKALAKNEEVKGRIDAYRVTFKS